VAGIESGQEENIAIRNMTVFRSTETDAKTNLIWLTLKFYH
jgi:hypothetical protein